MLILLDCLIHKHVYMFTPHHEPDHGHHLTGNRTRQPGHSKQANLDRLHLIRSRLMLYLSDLCCCQSLQSGAAQAEEGDRKGAYKQIVSLEFSLQAAFESD